MTKETKIGLLVGLAFIILFAIILSEKGASPRDARAPVFSPLDSTGPSIASAEDPRPLHDAGRLPVDSQLSPIISEPGSLAREEQIAQAAPDEDAGASPLPNSLAGLIGPQDPAPNATASATPSAAQAQPSGLLDDRVGPEYTPPAELSPQAAPTNAIVQRPVEESSSIVAARTLEKREPLKVKAEHVVQPGESLSKISAKYYARYTPNRVKAIMECNPEVLKSEASVRPGMKLRIPELGDAFEPAPAFAVAEMREPVTQQPSRQIRIPLPIGDDPTAKATPAAPRDRDQRRATAAETRREESPRSGRERLYEVRRKDTLSSIARRELGSEKLVGTLKSLNKDVLGKKNIIKPGMKLRLPVLASSAAEESSVLSVRVSDELEP